jgi:hypothetical protein
VFLSNRLRNYHPRLPRWALLGGSLSVAPKLVSVGDQVCLLTFCKLCSGLVALRNQEPLSPSAVGRGYGLVLLDLRTTGGSAYTRGNDPFDGMLSPEQWPGTFQVIKTGSRFWRVVTVDLTGRRQGDVSHRILTESLLSLSGRRPEEGSPRPPVRDDAERTEAS